MAFAVLVPAADPMPIATAFAVEVPDAEPETMGTAVAVLVPDAAPTEPLADVVAPLKPSKSIRVVDPGENVPAWSAT